MRLTMRTMMVLLAALAVAGTGCGTNAGHPGGGGGDGGGTVTDGGGGGGDGGGITDGGGGGGDGGGITDGGGGGSDGGGITDGGPADGGDGGWGPGADGGCVPVACQGTVYQCGDCIDNDNDGLTDWQDPDCLGPCDNNESGFDLAIPGDSQPKGVCTEDCYFDNNAGGGNDDCHWDQQCDPLAPGYGKTCSTYDPSKVGGQDCPATQSAQCNSYCGPLTPNGCDCFGCCELPGGSNNWVFIGSQDSNGNYTCTVAGENDPAKCHPCTPVNSCLKTCGRCQLCLGKTSVPPDCFSDGGTPGDGGTVGDGGTAGDAGTGDGGAADGGDGGVINPGQCPVGIQPCGLPGEAACSGGYYCITGCCQPTIP